MLILETIAFHILALRNVKFFVPVATLNKFRFLVSCEWISLFLENICITDLGSSSYSTLNLVIPILSIKKLSSGKIVRSLKMGSVCADKGKRS